MGQSEPLTVSPDLLGFSALTSVVMKLTKKFGLVAPVVLALAVGGCSGGSAVAEEAPGSVVDVETKAVEHSPTVVPGAEIDPSFSQILAKFPELDPREFALEFRAPQEERRIFKFYGVVERYLSQGMVMARITNSFDTSAFAEGREVMIALYDNPIAEIGQEISAREADLFGDMIEGDYFEAVGMITRDDLPLIVVAAIQRVE